MRKNKFKGFPKYVESFKAFKTRHKLTDQQITNIMTEYANTVDERGASFFASKYGFTEHVFYQIRDYTIVFMLVDASVCRKIRDKSFRNQGSKNSSGNFTTSANHYLDLIAIRREYLKTFSNEDIIKIAEEYASLHSSTYDIAKKHKISLYTLKKLLAIALVNHLVSEDVYRQIKFRSTTYTNSLRHYNGYSAAELWNYLHWE